MSAIPKRPNAAGGAHGEKPVALLEDDDAVVGSAEATLSVPGEIVAAGRTRVRGGTPGATPRGAPVLTATDDVTPR